MYQKKIKLVSSYFKINKDSSLKLIKKINLYLRKSIYTRVACTGTQKKTLYTKNYEKRQKKKKK
jgi:uncharacterized cysteine cluster protein YcgN (CxxCxxCC family)